MLLASDGTSNQAAIMKEKRNYSDAGRLEDDLRMISQRTHILTMNRGPATLKSALYEAGNDGELLVSMTVDRTGFFGLPLEDCGSKWKGIAGFSSRL
ncbi:hypothetical protein JAO29_16515 [Edaphobacter sp. HDX4]|uniref:hypothetical protein n=1 Tax=Edaphobacter sp. HDX4 TaxID=2794064 RepID=UPI002FE555C3